MLEVAVAKTWRQPFGIEVTQSLNAVITTIGMETIVVPNMNVVSKGVIIGSTSNLNRGLGKFLARRKLSRSSGLPMANIGVVGTPQMVFTDLIMIIHVHKTIDQPLMNSIAVGKYRCIDVEDPKGWH
jgi:hypothetical protein